MKQTIKHDPVNAPAHYRAHPSGIEAIEVTEHFNFCLGNAIKYIWRADQKGATLEDLKKARWYLDREIKRREASSENATDHCVKCNEKSFDEIQKCGLVDCPEKR